KPGGSTKPHALYNIGNNRSEPLMKVVEILEQECGRKAQLEMLPMQQGDVERTAANIDAIARDMGFAPTTTIEEGVPQFVRWYREYYGV
ncbi:MAG TPA: protein CapI, partial [Alteraurantiacibacter sp.]